MFIAIEHSIHDPTRFQSRGEQVFPLPDDLHVHHFLPANDFGRASCLYEAPSIDRLREYLDAKLGDASTQRYFAVADQAAIGLPTSNWPENPWRAAARRFDVHNRRLPSLTVPGTPIPRRYPCFAD